MITDGQPTAYFVGDELHVEWPSGFGGVSPARGAETLRQVRAHHAHAAITINTFMLDDSPELVRFVEAHDRDQQGPRVLHARRVRLGSYVMVDYLSRKRRKIR